MKFWLATANLERIETCLGYGIFEGIITNPHVVALEKTDPRVLFKEICEISPYAYYQLQADTREAMLAEAGEMIDINPDKMLIKVPATREGFSVMRHLTEQGQEVMATVVPTSAWMVFAAAAGAVKIAPYSGMLKRANLISKMEGVFAMQEVIDRQKLEVEICTGIYHVTEIPRYAARGIKSGFIWEKDVEGYLTQDLVGQAVDNFKEDWDVIQSQY